jgi:hypothetical protein
MAMTIGKSVVGQARPTSPRHRVAVSILAALSCIAASPAAAEVELTPLVGVRVGGSIGTRQGDLTLDPAADLGLMVSWRVRHDGLLEIFYARQTTTLDLESSALFDLDVDVLHFGGLWEIRNDVPTRPFLGLSVGATRMAPDPGGIGSESFFSAGISGGVKHFFGERVGIRAEGRGLLTFSGTSGGIFCSSSGGGGCAAVANGDALIQIQGLLGLIVRF